MGTIHCLIVCMCACMSVSLFLSHFHLFVCVCVCGYNLVESMNVCACAFLSDVHSLCGCVGGCVSLLSLLLPDYEKNRTNLPLVIPIHPSMY